MCWHTWVVARVGVVHEVIEEDALATLRAVVRVRVRTQGVRVRSRSRSRYRYTRTGIGIGLGTGLGIGRQAGRQIGGLRGVGALAAPLGRGTTREGAAGAPPVCGVRAVLSQGGCGVGGARPAAGGA